MVESAQPIGDLKAAGTISIKMVIDRNGVQIVVTKDASESNGHSADADDPAVAAFYAMRTAKKRQLRIVITQELTDPDDA